MPIKYSYVHKVHKENSKIHWHTIEIAKQRIPIKDEYYDLWFRNVIQQAECRRYIPFSITSVVLEDS